MPLPNPGNQESEKDFIARCMGDAVMNEEFPDAKQRAAVCHTQWRDKDKKAKDTGAAKMKQRQVMIPAERSEKECAASKMKAAPKVEGKVAELDPGWIEGYAAVFGNVDSVGDRILPGAFARTISERVQLSKVQLMAKHLVSGGGASEVIGTVTQAKEDDIGLWMHAVLSRTRTAQEIRQNVIDGHIGFLSIGYVTKDAEMALVDGKEIQDLKELALWEVTVTTVPVNELAHITDAKSEAVLAKDVPENADDSVKAKLQANRDSVEIKTSELNQLIVDRLELLDPEVKAEAKAEDTDAEDTAKDAAPNPIAELERKRKEKLAKMLGGT